MLLEQKDSVFRELIDFAAGAGWQVGADTAAKATNKVGQENYLQWSQEQIGPGTGKWPFWGRYLVRIGGICEGLTVLDGGKPVPTGELPVIFRNGTAIVLVDNWGTTHNWKDPAADAERAGAAAAALGIPEDMCVFVDIEAPTVPHMGQDYLSIYKKTIETCGAKRYRMGAYFSSSTYALISRRFNLSDTFTWIADWSGKPYPNWPKAFRDDIKGMGQVKLWQFISNQNRSGYLSLDLDFSAPESASDLKKFMYHPDL